MHLVQVANIPSPLLIGMTLANTGHSGWCNSKRTQLSSTKIKSGGAGGKRKGVPIIKMPTCSCHRKVCSDCGQCVLKHCLCNSNNDAGSRAGGGKGKSGGGRGVGMKSASSNGKGGGGKKRKLSQGDTAGGAVRGTVNDGSGSADASYRSGFGGGAHGGEKSKGKGKSGSAGAVAGATDDGGQVKPKKPIQWFGCSKCTRRFRSKKSLNGHEQAHIDETERIMLKRLMQLRNGTLLCRPKRSFSILYFMLFFVARTHTPRFLTSRSCHPYL
jgi:hypothetical protein